MPDDRTDKRRNGKPAGAGEVPEEFERFRDLTRKLLRVPKSDVDEKRNAPKPSPSTRPT
jgi:hypothetical protein